ncbi:MAG: flagellar protein FlgN [Pseudomonadota bacterium]
MSDAARLKENLRQMLAVLVDERQALAGLDLDAIMGAAVDKQTLCSAMADPDPAEIDDECRGLLEAARRLNEVNRQVRNLVAANVAARLDALTGAPALYRAVPAYAYAGARG